MISKPLLGYMERARIDTSRYCGYSSQTTFNRTSFQAAVLQYTFYSVTAGKALVRGVTGMGGSGLVR